MAHQHRRTYTRTILFSETFDFPTPPTWGQDEATFPQAFAGHQYQHQRASQMPYAPWPAMPQAPVAIRPMSRMPRVSHVPATLYDKPVPEDSHPAAQDFVIDFSNSESTTFAPVAPAMPSPGEVSRWSVCSDDTIVESMSRPLSPSNSIQKLRNMASSTALRSVKSSMKLRSKLNTTLKQLTRRTKSMG